MNARPKKPPKFRSEAAERAFWETHDSTAYVDWAQAQVVRLARLKPSTETISLRLPEHLLDGIRLTANAERALPVADQGLAAGEARAARNESDASTAQVVAVQLRDPSLEHGHVASVSITSSAKARRASRLACARSAASAWSHDAVAPHETLDLRGLGNVHHGRTVDVIARPPRPATG